jgi:hypothetical protein
MGMSQLEDSELSKNDTTTQRFPTGGGAAALLGKGSANEAFMF